MSNLSTLKEALSVCLERGLTFVAFRPPGAPITIWAQRTPELDRVEPAMLYELNDVFLLASFSSDNSAIPLIRADVELTFGDLAAATSTELLSECEGRAPAIATGQPSTPQADYESAVRTAQGRISPNGLQKVVLSRVINIDLDRALLADLFVQACGASHDVLVTLLHTPDHGTWIGASPERSLIAEDDLVQVDALAGSVATEEAPSDPMQWGDKERHEQEVVSLAVFGDLMRWGSCKVHVSGPSVIHAGSMAHLRTVFEAERSERGLDELLVALHPTPAVCGAPRDLARTVIKELEQHDRALYGGSWGPWNADGRTELFVNIRCLRNMGNTAILYVGAGITAGSDPRKEWIETEQKAQTWLKPIAALRS